MKKGIYFLLIALYFSAKGADINIYKIHTQIANDTLLVHLELKISKSYQTETYFLFSDWIDIINIEVNGRPTGFSRNKDTLFFSEQKEVSTLKMDYKIPSFYSADAIILRRETRWFPHRRNELFISELTVSDTSQHIITQGEKRGNTYFSDITYEIHLLLLPKQNYAVKEMNSEKTQFKFFRHKNDTSFRSDFFYNEFLNAYDFFSSYFDDSTKKHSTMNIVEIYDRNFMMAQSLENLILFGDFFYWKNEPDDLCSWIPHEIAHQWWGNRVFFKFYDTMNLFLGESLTEFLKLRYIQHQRGLEKSDCFHEKNIAWLEDRGVPVSEVNDLNSRENVVVVYSQVPFLLNEIQSEFPEICFIELISEIYRKHYRNFVRFDDFYKEFAEPKLRNRLDFLLFHHTKKH